MSDLDAEELHAAVGYKKAIIEYYGDEFEAILIMFAHQREQTASRAPY